MVELADARDSKSRVRKDVRVRPPPPAPKNTAEKDAFSAVFFYPSRRLGISSPHEVWWISSALWAVYHHASACIFLRLDDIQNFVLMICNSFDFADEKSIVQEKENIELYENIYKNLIEMSQAYFSKASEYHFALESIYTPLMNFDKINEMTEKIINEFDTLFKSAK